jgi:hypothetical protein
MLIIHGRKDHPFGQNVKMEKMAEYISQAFYEVLKGIYKTFVPL